MGLPQDALAPQSEPVPTGILRPRRRGIAHADVQILTGNFTKVRIYSVETPFLKQAGTGSSSRYHSNGEAHLPITSGDSRDRMLKVNLLHHRERKGIDCLLVTTLDHGLLLGLIRPLPRSELLWDFHKADYYQ
ncbi:hypothetical protein L484_012693 [Morus notabilis]|uniref:Uncharacterized protein n=1 Tax=Morus notabilis TaxID=981085 RepID=W9S409_9ROSA|nr:hypothetical protein L484_012693 [Morus notabilis]